MICLSSIREKGLWTQVDLNSPPFSTKGHTQAGFCGGGAPGYGGIFGYKEEAPDSSGAMGGSSLLGGMGGEPFGGGGSFLQKDKNVVFTIRSGSFSSLITHQLEISGRNLILMCTRPNSSFPQGSGLAA